MTTFKPQQLNPEDFLRKLRGAVILMGGREDLIENQTFVDVVRVLEPNNIKFHFTMEIPDYDS